MRKLLFVMTVLAAAIAASPASATTPVREHVAGQDDVLIPDQCAFPVLAHIEGGEIDTLFTDRTGEPVKLHGIFPGNMLTLTNLATDASVTVPATGLSQTRTERDGTISMTATGHGPFISNPVTGAPGIWYLSGRARATFDQEGNLLTGQVTGRLVNLCGRLAP